MKLRKKILVGALAATLAFSVCALAGCSGSSSSSTSASGSTNTASSTSDDKVIKVGATVPHYDILKDAVAPILEKEGYTLELTEFTDYVLPNDNVEQGTLDANYFQHISYLNSFNEEKGTHLVSVGYVHYEPFGLYAGKTPSLKDIKDGAVIAVPDDTTNEARALLLLQQEGLITLKDDAGLTATTKDIVENPYNLQIKEVEAANVPHVLSDCDFGVINGNYAISAGIDISTALATESSEGLVAEQYGNVLVVKDGNQNSEKIQALYKALTSDEVKKYMEDTYKGAVVPLF